MDNQSVNSYAGSGDDEELRHSKSADEFNIQKEASEDLFAVLNTSPASGNSVPPKPSQRRSCTFAENLEKYAPDSRSECISATGNVAASDYYLAIAGQKLESMHFDEASQAMNSPDIAEQEGACAAAAAVTGPGVLPKKQIPQMSCTMVPIEKKDGNKCVEQQQGAGGYFLPTRIKFARMPKEMECDVFDAEELEIFKEGNERALHFGKRATKSLTNLVDSDGEEVNNK